MDAQLLKTKLLALFDLIDNSLDASVESADSTGWDDNCGKGNNGEEAISSGGCTLFTYRGMKDRVFGIGHFGRRGGNHCTENEVTSSDNY